MKRASNAEKNGIGVTDIKVYKIKSDSLKANVAVTFNDLLVVYFKLIEGKNGMFISWPNHSYKEGSKTKYRDDVYSLNKEFVDDLTDLIIEAYENA